MLNNLNRDSVNIMTIEDPVEYTFKGINQAGLNPKAGITFPAALRSIMRHDPDIVMVGEIRDYETSLLLIQGALTGHLILTNLHTNTATDAVIRLRDIGVEPFLIRDALTGVVAQCLVRKLCEHCRKEYKPEKEMIEHLNLQQGKKFFKAVGCERCHNGYRGRIAIHELFQFGDTTKKLILKGCSPEELRNQAVKEGMVTIRQDGINKVAQGLTTLKEIIRVTSA
jgi:type II secretory ATPase GspE/PulE/Tfp pilus assembly ATPase PilB-like protein